MYTCAQLATAKSKRIQTLYGKETHQRSIHMANQVDMWIALLTKMKLYLFNVNQPMPDD
jgi:hypothetical protein